MEFNITVKELERALEFALEQGKSPYGTVTVQVMANSGIGNDIIVSNDEGWSRDVTETESW